MAVRAPLPLLTFSLLLLTLGILTNAESRIFETVSVDAFLPSTSRTISTGSVKASGYRIMEIVHHKTSSAKEVHSVAIAKDSLRVASIQKRLRDEPGIPGREVSIYPKTGLNIGNSIYTTMVTFGDPARNQTIIMDTSTDLSWIQCKPCFEVCYPQKEPLFDPAFSSTYHKFTSNSTICRRLGTYKCYNGKLCYYEVGYGENIYSSGFLVSDTLRLPTGDELDDFIFGCGQKNQGFSSGFSGLLGLGRSAYSLNSQLVPMIENIFSYCLPSMDFATGYLNLGKPPKTETRYTPMLTESRAPSMYFLNLTGLTVGGKKLDISPSVFQPGGTIIDSGTEITRLPPEAYKTLKAAFRANMTKYPLAEASTVMDTCYDLSKVQNVTYPIIWLHFDGLDVKVPWSGVFFAVTPMQYCLSFAGNSGGGQTAIIGTLHQRTMEVTYDNVNERVGFAQGACE